MIKKKKMSPAVAFRWGRMIADLATARNGVRQAMGGRDMLSEQDQDLLEKVESMLFGLEQRAWEKTLE